MSMRLGGHAICWIGACTFAVAAYAGPPNSAANSDAGATTDRYYAFVYLGGFETHETAEILDRSTDRSSIGGGWGWGFHRFLTFEFDASFLTTEYDLPQGIGRPDLGDDKLELSTIGALGNVKFGPRLGRLRPHVGVGLGFGVVDVSITNPELWFPLSLESRLSLLTQVVVGLDVRVSRRSHVGIEYRELTAHRTIHFGGEEIDGGGQSFVLAYRRDF
jgi:hypothetical protein